jgi:hypothetical protein
VIPEEPSVLDYVKSRFRQQVNKLFGLSLPEVKETGKVEKTPSFPISEPTTAAPATVQVRLPWLSLLALVLALLAQLSLEPRQERTWIYGVIFYTLAAIGLVVAYRRGEWRPASLPPEKDSPIFWQFHSTPFLIGLVLSGLAFLAFGGNRFTSLNVTLWIATFLSIALAFVDPSMILNKIGGFSNRFRSDQLSVKFSYWILLVIVVFLIGIFFRTYLLADIPSQMVSDHAEKLWDVQDVLKGQTSIYFPRNTGREFFQMYLTAGVILLMKTGLSFTSLKLGTVLCGILTLPFIYLIGKEIANRQVGLIAMAFAGIAYWPNLISRIALRFTLYPFFYALALYFFLRGLNRKSVLSFLASGLFMGLGLHGYSPFRVVPIVFIVGVLLYILHNSGGEKRKSALFGLAVVALLSLVVFLPLLRYSLENPDMFWYRAMTRLSDMERPVPGNAAMILAQNTWRALTMFAWDNGEVWVISVVHRPVLDFISAALFHLGILVVIVRYIEKRHWHDLFLLASIPLLLLPSIMSIAFPGENPSLNRTAGALVPVFLVIGIALDSLLRSVLERIQPIPAKSLVIASVLILFGLAAAQNYDLVFNQYAQIYELSSWNTSEIGEVVRDFSKLQGSPDTAWLVASPHWVDSRLVMINAGFPGEDNPIWPDQIVETLVDPRPKLFIIRHNQRPEDQVEELQVLSALQQIYPQGWAELYPSQYPTKDFWMFFTPPAIPGIQSSEPNQGSTP